MIEKLIAYYCGPSLAGIKPSNIASVSKEKYKNIHIKIKKLNEDLNKKDIYIRPLCECRKRVLVIVYRKKVLEKHLKNQQINKFLAEYGYSNLNSAEEYIAKLKDKLSFESFPHEIGAFLGYPLHDVYGFINNPKNGCLLVGEWKVYGDVENAKKLFCRYDNCRRGIIKRMNKGHSLERIFCTA